jgi:HSP20 family protein
MDRIRREIDRIFSETFGRFFQRDYSGVFPPVNLYETPNHYILTAEMPGVALSDVEITATEDSVTIHGERKSEDGGERASYHRRERGSGRFRRIVTLPDRIDPDRVDATLKNGILTLKLAKAEEVKPKKIEVKAT